MKNTNNITSKILILILIISIYFSLSDRYINMNYISVLSIVLLLIHIISVKKYSVKINKTFMLLFSISIIFLISSFVFSSVYSLKYSIYFLAGVFLYLIGSNIKDKKTYIINCLKNFSFLFAIMTIMSALVGSNFNYIYKMFFNNTRYLEIISLAEYNCFSGIAGQTGLNAFFISIGLLITYINILTKKNKVKQNLIILLIYITALMLTAKRAILLYNIIMMIAIICYQNRKNLLKMIKYFSILLTIGAIIVIAMYSVFPRVFYVVERFFNQTDISTGRFDLYEEAWQIFEENRLYGIGINNFSDYMEQKNGNSIQAHNVPIQLLAEIGLFQTIYVLSIVIYIYIISIKKTNSSHEIESYYGIAIQTLFLLYFITGNALYDVPILYIYIIALILSNNKKRRI